VKTRAVEEKTEHQSPKLKTNHKIQIKHLNNLSKNVTELHREEYTQTKKNDFQYTERCLHPAQWSYPSICVNPGGLGVTTPDFGVGDRGSTLNTVISYNALK